MIDEIKVDERHWFLDDPFQRRRQLVPDERCQPDDAVVSFLVQTKVIKF